MGREAYTARLALGRSAFEPPEPETDQSRNLPPDVYVQQYDRRGHPMNLDAVKSDNLLFRAQNKVLAACGVILEKQNEEASRSEARNDADSFKRHVDLVVKENEMGSRISTVFAGVLLAGSWWMMASRYRVETFKLYGVMNLPEALKLHIRSHGLGHFFCAGLPAFFVHETLSFGFSHLALLHSRWSERILSQAREGNKSSPHWSRLVKSSKYLMTLTISLILTPFQLFLTLQTIGLLPARPMLPSFRSLVPFSASSPIRLPTLPMPVSFRGGMSFFFTVLGSPLFLLIIYSRLTYIVQPNLHRLIKYSIPVPDIADRVSYEGLVQSDDDPDPVTLHFATKVWAYASNWLSFMLAIPPMAPGQGDEASPGGINSGAAPINQIVPENDHDNEDLLHGDQDGLEGPGDGVRTPVIPGANLGHGGTRTPTGDSVEEGPPDTRALSPILSSTSDSDESLDLDDIQLPPPPIPRSRRRPRRAPRRRRSIAPTQTSPQRRGPDPDTFRVSTLTWFPTDFLAFYSSRLCSTYLLWPLEALITRRIATGFLSSPATDVPGAQARAALLLSDVWEPMGPWGGALGLRSGGGGWKVVGRYFANVLMCAGIETVGLLTLSQSTFLVTRWFGVRWYGWGTF